MPAGDLPHIPTGSGDAVFGQVAITIRASPPMKLLPIQDDINETDAKFSGDGKYRYYLTRIWNQWGKVVVFVGLNPSTADKHNDDPTVRRCITYARRWGFGGIIMLNAFAYRATDPREMKQAPQPVGSENDHWLKLFAGTGAPVVAAWGAHAAHGHRHLALRELLPETWCLDVTKHGHPKHPLYLRGDLLPRIFTGPVRPNPFKVESNG